MLPLFLPFVRLAEWGVWRAKCYKSSISVLKSLTSSPKKVGGFTGKVDGFTEKLDSFSRKVDILLQIEFCCV